MEAMECGIEVVKFFPANIYGGLAGMKALSGPFPGIKFLPTGGISEQNVAEYFVAP
jgi:2-dehydro-3-deoxyphosphogluconate aldolase/(4S)-4-hydroxy-2-oxoglutarate aldolase